MIVKEITYPTYDGEEITEKFYFNLNEAELAEMELDQPGGLMAYIEMIKKANNKSEIIRIFKLILSKAYGKKSLDGKRLEKSEEISREFMQTEAYNVLFKQFISNDMSIADFIFGVFPPEWTEKAKTDPKVVELVNKLDKR